MLDVILGDCYIVTLLLINSITFLEVVLYIDNDIRYNKMDAGTITSTSSRVVVIVRSYQKWLIHLVFILVILNNNNNNNNGSITAGRRIRPIITMLLAEGFANTAVVTVSRCHRHRYRHPHLHQSTSSINDVAAADDDGEPTKKKKKKKKKKTQLVISTNLDCRDDDDDDDKSDASGGMLSGTISSNGSIDISRPKSTKLGVPSKRKMKDLNSNSNNDRDRNNKRLSVKAQKIKNQRTSGGGVINGNGNGNGNNNNNIGNNNIGNDDIRIVLGKRGSKTVTMIQGMANNNNNISLNERKQILKEIKNKVGGGGSIVENGTVLEIQGSHTNIVYEFLVLKGYKNIKK